MMQENIVHSAEELKQFPTLFDQLSFRKQKITDTIEKHGFSLHDVTAIASRGGVIKTSHIGRLSF